jgi:hypothetical protein
MKKLFIITISLVLFAISATPTYAHSGCCSHHGGVSGCGCADGSPLSQTCAPYYPECSTGAAQTAPQTQTAPVVYSTPKPYIPVTRTVKTVQKKVKPTATPKPKKKKVVKKKGTKKVVKKKVTHKKAIKPTPTPHKKKLK